MKNQERTQTLSRKNVLSALRAQLRSLRWVMLVIYTPVVVALGIVVVVRITTGFPMADLTRDPLQIAQVPVYTGVLSNLGVLVWAGTAAICLFSYAVVRNRAAPGTSSRFLLAGGLVTVMLLLDAFLCSMRSSSRST